MFYVWHALEDIRCSSISATLCQQALARNPIRLVHLSFRPCACRVDLRVAPERVAGDGGAEGQLVLRAHRVTAALADGLRLDRHYLFRQAARRRADTADAAPAALAHATRPTKRNPADERARRQVGPRRALVRTRPSRTSPTRKLHTLMASSAASRS
eukprot:6174352-Pleurochrysis_carterae.AAC.5